MKIPPILGVQYWGYISQFAAGFFYTSGKLPEMKLFLAESDRMCYNKMNYAGCSLPKGRIPVQE